MYRDTEGERERNVYIYILWTRFWKIQLHFLPLLESSSLDRVWFTECSGDQERWSIRRGGRILSLCLCVALCQCWFRIGKDDASPPNSTHSLHLIIRMTKFECKIPVPLQMRREGDPSNDGSSGGDNCTVRRWLKLNLKHDHYSMDSKIEYESLYDLPTTLWSHRFHTTVVKKAERNNDVHCMSSCIRIIPGTRLLRRIRSNHSSSQQHVLRLMSLLTSDELSLCFNQ